MKFVPFSAVAERLCGKRVAIVGSAPSCLENEPGFVDSHDIVVRVNNYKTGPAQGVRCDVHYSFYGTSIRKSAADLQRDGVTLCMNKLPNDKPINSEWHEQRGKMEGIDYRYIYRNRKAWWFCDTFMPETKRFMDKFNLLGRHQPTTGFAGILDVLGCEPLRVYLTGFDFFTSGLHNVDEPWQAKNPDDPICHRPDLEAAWLRENADNYPLTFDVTLTRLLAECVPA